MNALRDHLRIIDGGKRFGPDVTRHASLPDPEAELESRIKETIKWAIDRTPADCCDRQFEAEQIALIAHGRECEALISSCPGVA